MQPHPWRQNLLRKLALIVLAAGTAIPAFADRIDDLGYDFAGFTGTVGTEPALYSFGMVFTVDRPITVTSLGYFDWGNDGSFASRGDGLTVPHEVGIFNSGGGLVTSTILSAGTPGAMVGVFRMQKIAPVDLEPGNYLLAGTSGGISEYFAVSQVSPGVVYHGAISIANGAAYFFVQGDNILRLPTQPASVPPGFDIYAGPNFEIAPEPGTWILLGSALMAGFLLKTRRRTRP